jgi:hypothetical protein
MLINVYLRGKALRTDDRGDKLFFLDHGRDWERVATIKDSGNYASVIDRLKKQYNATDVFEDAIVKKKWGWKYFTDDEKMKMVAAVKLANTGKTMSDSTKAKMAHAKRGKPSNARGSRKSALGKALVSMARMGKPTTTGLKWCHHPITGEEGRKRELPAEWVWGRSPEVKDYLRRY